jgi:hypothetical protein
MIAGFPLRIPRSLGYRAKPARWDAAKPGDAMTANSGQPNDFVQMLVASGGLSLPLILVREVHSLRAAELAALLLDEIAQSRLGCSLMALPA